MSYYEKNYWTSVRRHWKETRNAILDPVAIGIGDEIVSKDRPTPNQFGTMIKILETAPRDENPDNFSDFQAQNA